MKKRNVALNTKFNWGIIKGVGDCEMYVNCIVFTFELFVLYMCLQKPKQAEEMYLEIIPSLRHRESSPNFHRRTSKRKRKRTPLQDLIGKTQNGQSADLVGKIFVGNIPNNFFPPKFIVFAMEKPIDLPLNFNFPKFACPSIVFLDSFYKINSIYCFCPTIQSDK
jgi:hypothetical protein